MTICFDYDNTFTRNPGMWMRIIKLMRLKDHRVILCTMRHPGESVEEEMFHHGVDPKVVFDAIYYTGRLAKVPYMESTGEPVDIWIEDSPQWLFQNG